MPELKEPTPYLIRQEIENIKDPEVRMFAKVILTCGGRTVEFAGKNCHNEKAYGTIGAGHRRVIALAWTDLCNSCVAAIAICHTRTNFSK